VSDSGKGAFEESLDEWQWNDREKMLVSWIVQMRTFGG